MERLYATFKGFCLDLCARLVSVGLGHNPSAYEYYIALVITTNNDEPVLSETLRSIKAQRLSRGRIKVVVVDNNSSDATLAIAARYSDELDLAIYKSPAKKTETQLFRDAAEFLGHFHFKYISVLRAGDKLTPSFVCRCSSVMDRYSGYANVLITAAYYDQERKESSGVEVKRGFPFSCLLLKKIAFHETFSVGINQPVLCFVSASYFGYVAVASETPYFANCRDLSQASWHLVNSDCLYLSECLSYVKKTPVDDPVDDLLLRHYMLSRFNVIVRSVQSDLLSDESLRINEEREQLCRDRLNDLSVEYEAQCSGIENVLPELKLLKEVFQSSEEHRNKPRPEFREKTGLVDQVRNRFHASRPTHQDGIRRLVIT